jgi:hypothetical protein
LFLLSAAVIQSEQIPASHRTKYKGFRPCPRPVRDTNRTHGLPRAFKRLWPFSAISIAKHHIRLQGRVARPPTSFWMTASIVSSVVKRFLAMDAVRRTIRIFQQGIGLGVLPCLPLPACSRRGTTDQRNTPATAYPIKEYPKDAGAAPLRQLDACSHLRAPRTSESLI